MKKVRFAFKKLMKVGRSTETVRFRTCESVVLLKESLFTKGMAENQVNSMPQLVFVKSSAKSVARPKTLRRAYSSVSSPPLCQAKSMRPKRCVPPARTLLRFRPATAKKPFTLRQNCGAAKEHLSGRQVWSGWFT